MLRFWIRVNARLADDAGVQIFAASLFPREPSWRATALTCGLLVTLWGRVADERENGDLTDVPDSGLESWAGWHGKRGLFATSFRAQFVEANGVIKEWATYQGKLIERREKDRKRKRGDNSAGTPQEVHDGSGGNPLPNGNGHSPAAEPKGSEQQGEAPETPAPEGARPALGTGDYLDSPSRREELMRRGLRVEQSGTPTPLAEAEAEARAWHDKYVAASDAACEQWLADNPEEAAALELQQRRDCFPKNPTIELGPLGRDQLRGAMNRALVTRLNWPGEEVWISRQKKKQRGAA